MTQVFADLHPDGKSMYTKFSFGVDGHEIVRAIKTVPGRRFVPPDKGGPYWKLPLDYHTAKALRAALGNRLVLSQELSAWGWEQKRKQDQLGALGVATTAKLDRLPTVLPKLHRALYVGPLGRGKSDKELDAMAAKQKEGSFQCAGAKFVATADDPLIGDQPGLGKTMQAIGGIFEAGLDAGPNLVIAPLTALETVWKAELEAWQPHPVYVAPEGRKAREDLLDRFFVEIINENKPGWLVLNPHMVAYKREKTGEKDELGEDIIIEVPMYHGILETNWANIIIDESHKNAVRNPKTLTAKAMNKLKCSGKRIAITGTPITNKPIDLWGQLHFLHPEVFTSKWRWADQWLTITDNGFGKVIGGLKWKELEKSGRKEEAEAVQAAFFEHLAPYILRRLKSDVLEWLPPKQYVHRWATMTPKQAKQYKAFARDADVEVNGTKVTAQGVLDEGIRMKQFATAYCEVRDGVLHPTTDSGKIAVLEEELEARGIFEGSDEKVVIFSQYERVIAMLTEWFRTKGVETMVITGGVAPKKRTEIQNIFQADGGPQVLLMTTTAGGVSITLDRADTCIFMDETWSPEDQEQAEDRLHRASRMHNVTVIYIRTKDTVEEAIMNDVQDKADTHAVALAIREHFARKAKAA